VATPTLMCVRPQNRLDPTPCDDAWAAGFFDGEGTLVIRRRPLANTINFQPHLAVEQIDPRPLCKLAELYGGSVVWIRDGRVNARDIYRWRIQAHGDIEFFLGRVLPYLIVKREQAQIMLRLTKTKLPRGAMMTSELTEKRERLYHELKTERGQGRLLCQV
jgi:hypothetical protein